MIVFINYRNAIKVSSLTTSAIDDDLATCSDLYLTYNQLFVTSKCGYCFYFIILISCYFLL